MNCTQPKVVLPVDFTGSHLNVMIGHNNKVWVCIDGQSVLRAVNLSQVTIDDHREPAVQEAPSALPKG